MKQLALRIANKIGDGLTATFDHYQKNKDKGLIRSTILLVNETTRDVAETLREKIPFTNGHEDAEEVEVTSSRRKSQVKVQIEDDDDVVDITPEDDDTDAPIMMPGPRPVAIQKKEPAAVTVREEKKKDIMVQEEEPVAVAVQEEEPKAITEQPETSVTIPSEDAFTLSPTDLADQVGLTMPKTNAAVWYLGMADDPTLYREEEVSKSKVNKYYTPAAVTRIQDALKTTSIDDIWQAYKDADYGKK